MRGKEGDVRVIIVHRWGGTPEDDWYPWLKDELEKRGSEVIVPEMPNTDEPRIEEWVSHLKEVTGALTRDTCFVGHSIGCQAIMRYLEKVEGKVPKAVFVAGWFKLDNLEDEEAVQIARPWVATPIDFGKVRDKIGSLTVFLSSNEPYGFVEDNAHIFRAELGANVVIEENKVHFTDEDGIAEVPEVLSALL